MAIKVYKPTSAGRRRSNVLIPDEITKKYPEKKLIAIKKRKGGRSLGKITVRHKGGGAKRFIRLIDWKQNKFDMPARIEAIEYDPNRGARIALIKYEDNEKRYILASSKMSVGQEIFSSQKKIEIKNGNRLPLQYIPVGIMVHNVELTPGKGGELVRGAGTGALLMAVEGNFAQLKMPSTEIRLISKECLATIGQVGNPDHRLIRWGKAGRKRHLGIRPSVRGKAMNPVDHPHGGGEGSNPIGLKHPKTLWGKPALGVKTRKHKKTSNKLIIRRRIIKKRKK